METPFLSILYQDEDIVAVNKPHNIAVHPSKMHDLDKVFVLHQLRDQLGQFVYPAHRLDRKTSGVLVFALNSTMNIALQKMFANNEVSKTYHALVRGITKPSETIDYELVNESGKLQKAITKYKMLKQFEIDVENGKFTTARFSLVELKPQTGRFHQLRKHMAHILHPIINDRPHGCNKQNKIWKEKFNHTTMLLHATEVEFTHPKTNVKIHICAPYSQEFESAYAILEKLKHE